MMRQLKEYLKDRVRNFGYAFEGVYVFFRTEVHAKIHLVATAVVLVVALLLELSKTEWLFVFLAVFLVLITEMINSCIERTMNLIKTEYDPRIKIIKDMAAGFVLLAAIFAIIVAGVIVVPKLIH